MRVKVQAVTQTDFVQEPALAKIMNNRLLRVATELQDIHLTALKEIRAQVSEIEIHISYNSKYKIRYHIISPVSPGIAHYVAERCGRLGYMLWRSRTKQEFNSL